MVSCCGTDTDFSPTTSGLCAGGEDPVCSPVSTSFTRIGEMYKHCPNINEETCLSEINLSATEESETIEHPGLFGLDDDDRTQTFTNAELNDVDFTYNDIACYYQIESDVACSNGEVPYI